MKLTDQEQKRLSELVSKALDKNRPSLIEEEVKELQTIIKKLEAIKEAEAKENAPLLTLHEKIDLNTSLSFAKKALEFNHEKKPLHERAQGLIQEMKNFKNSWAYKEVVRQNEERKKKLADEKFYEDHAKQFGSTLWD